MQGVQGLSWVVVVEKEKEKEEEEEIEEEAYVHPPVFVSLPPVPVRRHVSAACVLVPIGPGLRL